MKKKNHSLILFLEGGSMILNTGNRTDIPGYYSEWFMNRIREGFVYTRNPYYPELVTKYSLSPKVVDIILKLSGKSRLHLPGIKAFCSSDGLYCNATICLEGYFVSCRRDQKLVVHMVSCAMFLLLFIYSLSVIGTTIGVHKQGAFRLDPPHFL